MTRRTWRSPLCQGGPEIRRLPTPKHPARRKVAASVGALSENVAGVAYADDASYLEILYSNGWIPQSPPRSCRIGNCAPATHSASNCEAV